jgi:hypothetical protein
MFKKNTVQDLSDLFVSPKTTTGIPVPHPAIREALIQASLDPEVRSIDYMASAVVATEQVDLGVIIVQRNNQRFLMDVVPGRRRRIRSLEDEGLALIALAELGIKPWVISAKELRREPRYSNALFVWLYNGHRVPREERERILRALTDKEPIQLGQLERSVRSGRDPFPSVMALVCDDFVELDLISQPIGRTTIVKSRTRCPR